jgi:hypothetical protein
VWHVIIVGVAGVIMVKQVGIRGSIETATWSNGLEDDPWPLLIETLDRIATSLERLLKIVEMRP